MVREQAEEELGSLAWLERGGNRNVAPLRKPAKYVSNRNIILLYVQLLRKRKICNYHTWRYTEKSLEQQTYFSFRKMCFVLL